jgi:hypothetical protein
MAAARERHPEIGQRSRARSYTYIHGQHDLIARSPRATEHGRHMFLDSGSCRRYHAC